MSLGVICILCTNPATEGFSTAQKTLQLVTHIHPVIQKTPGIVEQDCVNIFFADAKPTLPMPASIPAWNQQVVFSKPEKIAGFLGKHAKCGTVLSQNLSAGVMDHFDVVVRGLRHYQTVSIGGPRPTPNALMKLEKPLIWLRELKAS